MKFSFRYNRIFEQHRGTDSLWAEVTSFDTRIRRNIRLAEAPSYGQSIFQYAGESNGAQDYRSLAMEVMKQTQQMTRQQRNAISLSDEELTEEQLARQVAEREFARDDEQPWLYHSR